MSEKAFNAPNLSVHKEKLKKELQEYKDSLTQDVLLLGNDLSAGFSGEVIEQILAVSNEVNSVEDIHVRVDMWDFEFIVIWLVLHHSLSPPPVL